MAETRYRRRGRWRVFLFKVPGKRLYRRLARLHRPWRDLTLLLALALGALSCRSVAGSLPAPISTTPPASSEVPPFTATPPLSEVGASATAPALTAEPEPTASLPALDAYAWDDRTPFEAALTVAERPVLSRLPGATIYHIAIQIDPGLTRVRGQQVVGYTNQEEVALSEIVFRLFPNLLGGRSVVNTLKVEGVPTVPVLYQDETALRVPLAAPLAPGQSLVIAMDFDVTVPKELERNYGVLAAAQRVLALAHFYPYVAVYDDEGWNDEIAPTQGDVTYGDASFYIVRVQAPATLLLAGSGTVIDEQASADEQTVTYALGPARDFYLAASPDYVVTSAQSGETTVSVYAPKAFSEAAQKTVKDASEALGVFATRYGPYPYTELDLAVTPTYALGIEYPGAIALTTDLLNPDTNTSASDDALRRSVTIHEVGHQWFYNLIGNDQLDDPWLDESLTQYATWQYFVAQGDSSAAAAYYNSLRRRWSAVDFAPLPIGQPVAAYEDRAYSAIIYGRGPLFFEALAERIGAAALTDFLSDYTRTYRWGIATPEGLRTLAEQHCACDLADLWAEWVE